VAIPSVEVLAVGVQRARTLAPVLLSQGDLNRDGRISPEEFTALAEKWFKAWDSKGTGKLDEGLIRAGLDAIRNPAGAASQQCSWPRTESATALASRWGSSLSMCTRTWSSRALVEDVGVRYKGNGTFMEARDSLKRSLKIELNKYAKGQTLGGVKMLTFRTTSPMPA